MSACILIVDDNPTNLLLATTVLELAGYQLLQAADARQALEMLRTRIPDLILMDISLPDIDGLTLTRQLKNEDRLRNVPIVALTAFAMKGDEDKASDAGCAGYITKPINTREFPRQVASYLQQPTALRKLLIVDDHPTNITLLQAQLEAEGYQVLCASNGVEALELLNRHAVDGIISDILMPRMDGYRLCMEVRKSQSLATLPFVLYTSTYNSPADRKLAQAAGADAIVEKPAPINTLLAGLQSASRQPRPSSPPTALPELEAPVLKQYNETLIRKLEQKSAELGAAYDGLAQSEARLSGMVEAALDAIITADEDQKIILFNGAAEKMFGCSRGQALSSSLREFFPESLRAMLGEQIELFTASSQIGPRVGLRTVRGRRAGGMEFPVEASISRLETSRGPLYTLFLRDVTDRYRAEQALARSESALRMAQELANLAHVTTGPDGSFENCSDTFASLIGLSPQLAPQSIRAWLLLVHPDDRRLLLRSVVRAARTGLRTVTQYRLQHDTVTHHIHHVMDPLPAPSNARARHTRWFHTLQDISESKR